MNKDMNGLTTAVTELLAVRERHVDAITKIDGALDVLGYKETTASASAPETIRDVLVRLLRGGPVMRKDLLRRASAALPERQGSSVDSVLCIMQSAGEVVTSGERGSRVVSLPAAR